MAAILDHITVVAPSLEAGSAFVESALGVQPGPGRKHPTMATHNLLLPLGTAVYLEVIAPDPSADAVSRPRWFGIDQLDQDSVPRLAAWVASTDSIESACTPEFGRVLAMHRDHHTWQMAVRPDGAPPLEGAAPLLIQRAAGANPVAALPKTSLQFERLVIRHPQPDRVRSLLAGVGLSTGSSIAVLQGDRCTLLAEIRTPSGLRTLGEA